MSNNRSTRAVVEQPGLSRYTGNREMRKPVQLAILALLACSALATSAFAADDCSAAQATVIAPCVAQLANGFEIRHVRREVVGANVRLYVSASSYTELPASQGGVGRMCSFGESISMTPLQLGALVSAIANGGTLYYLQHPQSSDEILNFTPKVKRLLDIAPLIPEMKDGMEGAVNYGTARSLRANFHEFPVLGKTGTCSNNGTRFGWFASYADTPSGRIVTVIFLEGGRPTFGPKAAELTGAFYRGLWDRSYFQPKTAQMAQTSRLLGSAASAQ